MFTSIRKVLFTFALIFTTYSVALSQATVIVDQRKDACNGLINGSVRLTVTAGAGPFSYFLIGADNGSGPFTGPITQGVPVTVANLPVDNYFVSIFDTDPNPNYSTFILINNVATPLGVTVDPGYPIANTDCASPTGQIRITASGGTGAFNFAWTSTNGFTSTSEDISSLPGGTYSVVVSDAGTNCTISLGSIIVTDPSPVVQTVTSTTPQKLCVGTDATISLGNTEGPGVTYEVQINGVPTGITMPGSNGPITMTVPFASLADGNILTIRAANGACTPINMNGFVTIQIVPLPVPVIGGTSPVCSLSTNNVYTTALGQTNYIWSVSGGTITAGGTATSNTVTVTWGAAGTGTVSVNYTTADGCTATTPTVRNITISPIPTPTIGGPAARCVNSTGAIYTTELGQSGYVWNVTGGTITSGAGTNSIQVTWTTAGPQTVTVNYQNAAGCTAPTPTTYNVTVTPLPTPALGGNLTVCLNDPASTYTTDNGMTNYVWSVVGGTITGGGTATDPSVDVTWNTLAGVHTVSVNYTNPAGCAAATPTTATITVNDLPIPTIGGPNKVCANTTGHLYTTEPGQANYVWTVPAGGSITAGAGTNQITVTWTTAGARTVTVNYDNAAGCDATTPTTYNVTVDPLPTPVITGAAAVCAGTTLSLYNTAAGMTNYVWNVVGGTITAGGTATSSDVTVTWPTAGPGSVSVSFTDPNGCAPAVPTVFNVTVEALPVPTISGLASVCANTTGVPYSTEPGMSNYVWTISGGGTITSGNGTANVVVNWGAAGARTLRVNYDNAAGCDATTPTILNVTVSARPTPTITGGLSTVCAGLPGGTYATQPGMTNYVWTVSAGGTITAGGTATDNSVGVTWNTAGPQTVTVNYTNAANCAALTPASRTITVNPLPVPTLTGPAAQCVGSTGVPYNTDPGMTGYLWTVSAGGTITSGAGTSSIQVTWNTTGPQTVSVNYTNANGCTATTPTTINVAVNPVPTPTLNGSPAECVGATNVNYVTDAGMTNYVWTVSAGGTITSGAGTNSINVTWNTVGPQTVSVNYENASGCPASAATVLNVAINAAPAPTITGSATECVGATSVRYETQAGQSNYVWIVSAGGTIAAGGTATDNFVEVNWTAAGAQTVTVNYDNAAGCDAATPAVRNVVVNPRPTPALGGNLTPCIGASGVTYTTDASMTSYVWTVSAGGTITAGGTSTSPTVNVNWTTAGAQTVSVSYTNANGCTPAAPTVLNILVSPVPTPTISGLNAVCANTNGVTYTTETGMSSYVWTVSAGGTITSGAGTEQITVNWGAAGARTVRVNYNNAGGCPAPTATVYNVTVNPRPTITIGGDNDVCVGESITYTTQTPRSNYQWTVSAGGTIVTGGTTTSNSVEVLWNTAGAQSVSVNYAITATGCAAATPVTRAVTVNPPPTPTITGPLTPCVSTTGLNYSTQGGMTGYVWTVSAGGTITAGATTATATIVWSGSGPQTVTVNYTNANGCAALTPTTLNVNVNPIPTPGLSGLTEVCAGTTNVTYTTDAGQSNYQWSVPTGATITAGGATTQDFVTVTWNTAGTHTVSVNYDNTSGCPASSPTVINIDVNPIPTPTITGGAATECVGESVTYNTEAGMTNYVWAVSAGGTITAGTGTNSIDVTWNTAGPQTVSVNYDNADGCDATTPTVRNITVNPLPIPTITGPLTPCVSTTGVDYSTQGGMTGYVWTVSAGGTITAGATTATATIVWSGAGAQTVTVNYTNANGCTAATPTTINVNVNAIPTPGLLGLTEVCAGTTNVTYTTDAGQSNYQWSVPTGATITAGGATTQDFVTVTWNTAGTHTVSVNYDNTSGCPASSPTVVNVDVNPIPTPIITGGAATECVGESVTYNTEAGMTNYVWTVSAGGTITAGTGTNSIDVTWNTAGARTVSVNYDNADGCDATTPTVRNITVNPLPIPTITGPLTPCVSTTGVDYSTQGGMTGYVWTVSAGGTITAGATTATATIVWSGAGAQTVTVNYTDANGCTAATPTTINVNVNAIPTPGLLGLTEVCAGTTNVTYTTDAGQSNYQWSVPTGATITAGGATTQDFVTVTWNTAGTHTVSVNYDNTSGCPASTPTIINVDVNPIPTPIITGGAATECVGESVTYNTEAGMTNYVWAVSAGGTITGGTGTNSIDVTWNTAGPQTVSVNYDNADGCDATTPTVRNITVNPLPTPTITGPLTPCVSTTGVDYDTEGGMTGYVWTVSAGGTITAGATTATTTIVWSGTGAQTVTVNYTNVNGCAATTPTTLNVNVNAVPTPGLSGLTEVCAGTTNVTYTTDPAQSNYQWSIPTGATITGGGATTQDFVTVTWNTAGTHTVSVNYDNAAGCPAPTATSLSVTVDPIPTPTINGGTATSCIGGTVTYTTQPSMTNYDWDISAGGTITAGGSPTDDFVTVTWNTTGNQTVSVNYENADGCDAPTAATRTITVNAVPAAPLLTGNATPCVGNPVTYLTDASMNNYVWTVSGGGTITAGGTATDDFVTVNWGTATSETVSVIYTDPNGCTPAAAATRNITVSDSPNPGLLGSTSECVGATTVVYNTEAGMANYVWSITGGTITAGGNGSSSATVTWNVAGPQTITVNYENASGCSANTPTSLAVQVNPVPTPLLTGGLPAECSGTSVTYNTDPLMANYVWAVTGGTVTAGGTATSDFITITWNTPGAQTVSVNYDNASGCDAPTATTRTINVGNGAAPTILGLASVCAGATNVTYFTEPGMTLYDWDVLGGLILNGGNSTDNFVTVGWPAAGTQTIRINYTNASGCRAASKTVLSVIVGGPLVPSLAGSVNTCENATGVTYNTDPAQNNYVWGVTGGTITAGGTAADDFATVTWGAAGTGTISVNYDNTVGCPPSTATTRNVQINGRPTPTIGGGSATECVGESVTYTTEPSMTNYVWTYSAGATVTGGGTTTSNSITIEWAAAGPQSVTVTYTDANACSPATPTTFNLTVNTGVATPALNGPATACEGSTSNVYITDSGKTNYVWTVSAGGTITAGGTPADDRVTITWNDAGPQSVSVTYTDTNGCPVGAPANLAVTVDPAVEPALNGDIDVCVNATGVTYTTDGSQTNYVWGVTGGTITAGGTAADDFATITWNTSGNQAVTVNYTPATGCPPLAPTSLAVNVHALPVPTITASDPACENTSVTYTTEPSMTNYDWTITGGIVTGGGTPTSNTVTITWAAAGTPASVSVNYTDANGCSASTAVTQTITISPVPVPTLTGPLNPCQHEVGQEYVTEPSQSNYVWTVTGGTITSGGTATDNRVFITWTSAGNQSVSVNYENAAGCAATTPTQVTVVVKAAPIPSINGTAALCKGATGEDYVTEASMTNYLWNVSGGTVTAGGGLTDNTITVDWPTAGPGTVSVNYTNADGCTAEDPTVFNVTVQDTPTATMSGSTSTCIGTPTTITVTLTGGGPWDIEYDDGSGTPIAITGILTSPHAITVSPTITTTYELTRVTNTCGDGTFGGNATVTVTPIPGNPSTFGVDTWIGYVYTDAGDLATPLPGRINFNTTKYRGYIEAADIDNMSATSTYDVTTDEFDMNIAAGALSGPNVCGSFTDNFSVRYRMRKTFATAGIYVFNVGSDDGVRLLVDGVNVLPATAFNTHAYSVAQSAGICLTAGSHDFVIEYYEQDLQSRLSFDYAEIAVPVVAPSVAVCVNATAPTITASSPDTGVTGFVAFNWYTSPALTTPVATGASFTPTAAQLDMTAAGTTTFYVALEFACGKTLASVVDVNVVNSATLTVQDESVCEGGGIVDLTTLVTAAPAGGTFTFSGSPAITGNNFNPAGLNGTTVTIAVDYAIGGCAAPQASFDLTITNSAAITVPTTAVPTCESGADIDLTTLVSAAPAGGTFTFAGTGVSGSMFDPSGLSGNQTITVDYTAGGCAAPQATFTINVSPTADFTASNSSACQNGAPVNLLTRVSSASPAGGTFSFSGPGVSGTTFTPSSQPVGNVSIQATYTVAGCSMAMKTIVINVLDPSDPACTGGGTNCFVFNATVNTTLTKRPSCSDLDDGVFAVDVSSTTGGNIIVQLIAPDGTIVTQVHAAGLFTFPNLSPANYEYKLTDQFGNVCQQPYSMPVQSTVTASANPVDFENATCFGEASGKAKITASGSSSFYYSIDGGASWSLPQASPFEIPDLPPNGTYGILIGDKVNDACAASVQVTINNKFPAITAAFTIGEATCSGNDGELTVNASGGSGSYQYSIDGLTFQTSSSFDALPGGGGTVIVKDGSGCSQAIPYVISFPGYIAYDPPLVQDADCNNNGESGEITIDLTGSVGPNLYQVAISTDMFTEPDASQFRNYTEPFITFESLPAGNYYAYIKAINASSTSCATRTSVIEVKGVSPILYTLEQGCQSGTGVNLDKPYLFIKNIVGDVTSSFPGPMSVKVSRVFPPADVLTKPVNLTNENAVLFTYDADPAFMQFPGEYVITLSQVNVDAACLVTKTFTYNVPILLSAQVGTRSKSYPEIPTGSMQVVKFFGGTAPYDVRIELDSASSFAQSNYATNFEEVVANSNLDYAKQYKNIPAGRYKIQVVDSLGCFIQFNGRVPLDTEVYIPNIFTPNEDGVNDVFFVRNLPAGARLVITNRWGKEVYSSNDYQNDWKGEGVADGVYFYRLKGSDSESKAIGGWIEILRGNKP